MCVICVYESGASIGRKELDDMIDGNPDGFGIMYYDQAHKLVTKKIFYQPISLMKDMAWGLVKDAEKIAFPIKSQIAVHCRIATHGSIGVDNAHPFLFCNGYGLMHNGILANYGSKELSDTLDYSQWMTSMNIRYKGIIDDPDFMELIADNISPSKFVIAKPYQDRFVIVNKGLGKIDSNRWYSNLNHRTVHWTKNYVGYGNHSKFKSANPVSPITVKSGASLIQVTDPKEITRYTEDSNKYADYWNYKDYLRKHSGTGKNTVTFEKFKDIDGMDAELFDDAPITELELEQARYESLFRFESIAPLTTGNDENICTVCNMAVATWIDYDTDELICNDCKHLEIRTCISCGEIFDNTTEELGLCSNCALSDIYNDARIRYETDILK